MNISRFTTNAVHALSRKQRFLIAFFLFVVALLAFAPVAILGPAIGWPASLGNPAAAQLAAIAANAGAITLGYGVYALYSLAITPVAVLVAWRVTGLRGQWAALIVSFGALSTLARLIGILRWLTVMPVLAKSHATGDAITQIMTEQIFSAINAYGGGIGELLGVALFGGLWLLLAMIAALRNAQLPKWLGVFGLIVALMQLLLFLPALGLSSPIPVAVAVTTFVIWLMTFAIVIVFKPQSK
jgi:hypothetical protein